MAVNLKNVHARGVASIAAAYEDAQSEYRQAALAGDEDAASSAALKMANLEAMAEKFQGMANRAMTQQPQARNQFGLSPDEVEIAHKSFGPIKDKDTGLLADLSPEAKERLYLEKKLLLQRKRASGEYRMPEQNG
jgi:hypothetical protein